MPCVSTGHARAQYRPLFSLSRTKSTRTPRPSPQKAPGACAHARAHNWHATKSSSCLLLSGGRGKDDRIPGSAPRRAAWVSGIILRLSSAPPPSAARNKSVPVKDEQPSASSGLCRVLFIRWHINVWPLRGAVELLLLMKRRRRQPTFLVLFCKPVSASSIKPPCPTKMTPLPLMFVLNASRCDKCRQKENSTVLCFPFFFSLFPPQPVGFGVVGAKSGAAQFRTFSAWDRGPLSAAVEGFTDAATLVSQQSARWHRRKLFCRNRLSLRRPDVSRGGAVCRARRTGSLPSGRTEPGTMGSRGGPRLAAFPQVRNRHDDRQKCKTLNLRSYRRLFFFFFFFIRCLPGTNQHQPVSHLPPGPVGGPNHPTIFFNNGYAHA